MPDFGVDDGLWRWRELPEEVFVSVWKGIGATFVAALLVAACSGSGKSNTQCSGVTDCGANQVCAGGQCKPIGGGGCLVNSDCKSYEYCNSNLCVGKTCVDHTQCAGGMCLSTGVCGPHDGTTPLPGDTQSADQSSGSDQSTPVSDAITPPLTDVATPEAVTPSDGNSGGSDGDTAGVSDIVTKPDVAVSLQNCTHNAECSGETPVCMPIQLSNTSAALVYRCAGSVGTTQPGETCSVDADCASGQCLSGPNGSVCFGVCKTDGDCTNGTKCYPNMVTYTFDMDSASKLDDVYDSSPACVPNMGTFQSCKTHLDCTDKPGEVCLPIANRDRTTWELRCVTNGGSSLPGTPCLMDSNCHSGTCIPPNPTATQPYSDTDPGICFGMCTPATEAQVCFNNTVCLSGSFTVNNRGTDDTSDDIKDSLYFCRYPPQP